MDCRHCQKEFRDPDEYCPHCGVATKPSTKAENRRMGDNRDLIIEQAIYFVFVVIWASIFTRLKITKEIFFCVAVLFFYTFSC